MAANTVLKKMMEQARDASPMHLSPLHSTLQSRPTSRPSRASSLVRVSPFIGVQGHNTGMGSSLPSQYQERVFAQHAKFGTFEVPRIFLNRANEEKEKIAELAVAKAAARPSDKRRRRRRTERLPAAKAEDESAAEVEAAELAKAAQELKTSTTRR